MRRRIARRWGWLLIAAITFLIVLAPAPAVLSAPTDRVIRIDARSFAYAPETFSVNPGDHITIELVAHDVVHGLYLDGYDLNMTAEPGQTARLSFIADRSGAFRFRCSVTCGALHPFMIGKLNVGANDLMWRAIGLAMLAAFAGLWAVRR